MTLEEAYKLIAKKEKAVLTSAKAEMLKAAKALEAAAESMTTDFPQVSGPRSITFTTLSGYQSNLVSWANACRNYAGAMESTLQTYEDQPVEPVPVMPPANP